MNQYTVWYEAFIQGKYQSSHKDVNADSEYDAMQHVIDELDLHNQGNDVLYSIRCENNDYREEYKLYKQQFS